LGARLPQTETLFSAAAAHCRPAVRKLYPKEDPQCSADDLAIRGQEHWADKGGIKLFLWEKRRAPGTDHQAYG
jgi:hypothetical protein